MKRVIAQALFDYEGKANLELIEETLTDNSKVYNVMFGSFEYPAQDQKDAERIYGAICALTS